MGVYRRSIWDMVLTNLNTMQNLSPSIMWWTNPLLGQLALVELARPFVGISVCLDWLVLLMMVYMIKAASGKQQATSLTAGIR